jgi:hypothetical protein
VVEGQRYGVHWSPSVHLFDGSTGGRSGRRLEI